MTMVPRPPMGRRYGGRGFAIHIGCNVVDGGAYGGWTGDLQGCVSDARSMRGLAVAAGFDDPPVLLVNKHATSQGVKDAIGRTADRARPGDLVLLSFAGHGGQVPDEDGDEVDGLDEAWVLHDRMLLDDELRAAFAQFAADVRILVVADCCHSATSAEIGHGNGREERSIPDAVKAEHLAGAAGSLYRELRSALRYVAPAASVLTLGACRDEQTAYEESGHGLFTQRLLTVWSAGSFQRDHAAFRRAIGEGMPDGQTPSLTRYGGGDLAAFAAERPFTIAAGGPTSGGVVDSTTTQSDGSRAVTVTVKVELGA